MHVISFIRNYLGLTEDLYDAFAMGIVDTVIIATSNLIFTSTCMCVCVSFIPSAQHLMALLLSEDSYYFSTWENLVHSFFTVFSPSFSFFFFLGISSQHVLDFLDQSSISFVFLTYFLSLTRNLI